MSAKDARVLRALIHVAMRMVKAMSLVAEPETTRIWKGTRPVNPAL